MAAISFEHADDARTALHAIVSDPAHGKDALSSPQIMSNLLQDLLPDAPRETSLLMAAANAGLPAALREHVALGMDVATAIGLVAATLAAKTAFSRSACAWVVTELAVALGLASPDIDVVMPAGDEVGPGPAAAVPAGPGQTQVAQVGQGLAGTGLVDTGQVNTGQVNAGQVSAGQVSAGQVNAGQTQAGPAPIAQGTADSWQRAQGTDPAAGAGWTGPTAPLIPQPAQLRRRMAPAVLVGTCIVVAGGVVAAAIILGSASHSSSPPQGVSSPPGSGGTVRPSPSPSRSRSTPSGGGPATSYHRVATLNPGAPGSMTNVVWTPGSSVVATSDKNGTTYLWDPATARMTGSFSEPGAGKAFATAISPDGSMLAVGYSNGSTYLWDITSERLIATLSDPGPGTGKEVDSVAFSPDSRTLVSADGNGYAFVWRVGSAHPSSTPAMSLADPGGTGVWSATFSSAGTLATGDYHGNIYLWRLHSGSPSGQFTVSDGLFVTSLAFSLDGSVLAAGTGSGSGAQGGLYLFSTSSQNVQDITNPGAVWALSFNGSTLAAADDDGQTYLFHVDVGDLIATSAQTLTDPNSGIGGVGAMGFSPNGKWLVTGDTNGNAYVWSTS